MAGESTTSEEVASVLAKVQKLDISAIQSNEGERLKALKLSKQLTAALDGPVNRAVDLVFQPYFTIAARIAVGLDLFSHIVKSPNGITSKELAEITKGEEALISRVLRVVASINFVEELEEDKWNANSTTRAMATAPIAAGHRFVFDALITSAIKAPKFLQETNWKAPTEPTDGFVQYAKETKHNIFDYLMSIPPLFQDFNLFMGNTMGSREYWYDWYDVTGRLFQGFDDTKSPALIVDVAGGKGHDLQAFHDKFKVDGYEGELILQEQPMVLEGISEGDLDESIKKMAQDFFAPQTIKGARAYFLHHILHDWSDKYCHIILKQLRDAMAPGYSKLLIHDLILPNKGAAEMQARFDLTMMTFNSGMERSKSQWTNLLQSAGFKVLGVWEHFDTDGIVEAEVAAAGQA